MLRLTTTTRYALKTMADTEETPVGADGDDVVVQNTENYKIPAPKALAEVSTLEGERWRGVGGGAGTE